MNYGGGHGEFFLHAVGVVGDQRLGAIAELHEIEQLGGALSGDFAIEAVHAADEIEIFRAGEASEKREAFGNDANLAFYGDGIGDEIGAENGHAPFAGREQAGEHLDGGGFSGAIGAEKSEELAGSDGQIDVVHGEELAEAAREIFRGDGGSGHERINVAQRREAQRMRARGETAEASCGSTARTAGSSMRKIAPPSTRLSAVMVPPCS